MKLFGNVAVALVGYIFSMFVCFRGHLLGGDLQAMVDFLDGQLILSCFEHWYMAFSGDVLWNAPLFFYPQQDVLGYTDTFFLNGVVYSIFRVFGWEPVMAMHGSLFVYASLGYFSFLFLLLRIGVGLRVAAAASILFICGAPIQTIILNSHLQLLSIWLVPAIVLLAEFGRSSAQENRLKRATFFWAGAFFVYALLTFSTFYIGWFVLFVASWCFVVWVLLNKSRFGELLKRFWELKRYLFIAGSSVLPILGVFIYVYLPAYNMSGGRSFMSALATLPDWTSFGSMNRYNAFWFEKLKVPVSFPEPSLQNELYYGFPWFFLITFIVLFLLALKNRNEPHKRFMLWAGIAVFSLSLVMARFGDYSLWAIVMKVVPGADGIRAVFRLNTILYVIALASVAKYLSVLIDRKFNIGFRILTLLLCLLLFAENWMIEKHFRLQLQSEEWVMKGIDPPPYPIDAFWGYRSIDPNTSILPKELLSLEGHMMALRLAQTLGVPTINGNSGMLPDGWHLKEIAFYDE
ncbi:MAG: hypothetical protein AAF212_07290, partial [Verrucomicrobiota bacterium]